ncbi:aldolase [Actinobacteria bacterium YIM 96077]|uniref:Aldolase n=1 Tax=Phytoactinopolyspora halophila TaxID=1981511 RepID=A0A329QCR5_9ACTN|nr:aldolase [Phytoactinopolyspora halophila]AYY13918.1 aldolase [Actinobacteria bacterium YIM 96077]RAW10047.1 aldolase [Phytoactinopolyspora halophila]
MSAERARLGETRIDGIVRARTTRPEAVAEAAARRVQPDGMLGSTGKMMVIAADHPARGSLRAGSDPLAMADRADLLERLMIALERPGVNGVLGTADVLEDLLLLGALDGKVVVGSMNRAGLAGSVFEIDDRFTGYDAAAIEDMGFEMGKMLLRIDPEDPATPATLQACARAVSELAARRRIAMVEPFISYRTDGRVRNDLSTEAVLRSVAVAAGLGTTSAYTWLKLPVVDDDPDGMERVLAASTLPAVLLGGEVPEDPDAAFRQWEKVLRLPTAMGLVVGRTLLYPPDGDVAGAVDTAVNLL